MNDRKPKFSNNSVRQRVRKTWKEHPLVIQRWKERHSIYANHAVLRLIMRSTHWYLDSTDKPILFRAGFKREIGGF